MPKKPKPIKKLSAKEVVKLIKENAKGKPIVIVGLLDDKEPKC